MVEVVNKCLIGNGEFFPTIHIKIDKNDSFLYCLALYILLDGKSIELCHCDNFHNKGHHIHYKKFNGTEKEESFNFESIGKTIDYFQENWTGLMERYKNE